MLDVPENRNFVKQTNELPFVTVTLMMMVKKVVTTKKMRRRC
jgi:hypothetical protein